MALARTLTIAGTDVSGGAGIAADLKAFQEHETYGFSVLTTVVSMEPSTWSHRVSPIPIKDVKDQLETALTLNPDVIKTGMLPSEEVVELSRDAFLNSNAKHFVVDPVMVCKGDDEVLNPGLVESMIENLIPHATVVTPNLVEAGHLAGVKTPRTLDEIKEAAKLIHAKGANYVVVKGARASKAIQLSTFFTMAVNFIFLNLRNSIPLLTTVPVVHLRHRLRLTWLMAKSLLRLFSSRRLSLPAQLKMAGR